MAMTPYSGDTSVIGKLGTTPQERGLTTQQFKDKFDEGLKAFVEWFNETHKTEFEAVQTDLATHKADIVTDADGAHGLKVESGTFTPVLKFGGNNVGMTFDRQLGQYYKIGKIVHIEVELRLTAKGTSEGAATIEGLPFVKATGPVSNSSYALGSYAYLVCPTNVTGFCLRILSNTSNILLYGLRSNDTLAGISHSQFNNNTHIYFGLTYLTN
jgi:hypothetical protein